MFNRRESDALLLACAVFTDCNILHPSELQQQTMEWRERGRFTLNNFFFLVWQIGLPRFTWLPRLHPQPNANGSRIYGGETPHRHLSQQNGKRRWVTERGESALFSFSTIDPLLILPFSRNKGATKCTINSVLVQIIIPCHSIPKPLISAAPLPFLENSF